MPYYATMHHQPPKSIPRWYTIFPPRNWPRRACRELRWDRANPLTRPYGKAYRWPWSTIKFCANQGEHTSILGGDQYAEVQARSTDYGTVRHCECIFRLKQVQDNANLCDSMDRKMPSNCTCKSRARYMVIRIWWILWTTKVTRSQLRKHSRNISKKFVYS